MQKVWPAFEGEQGKRECWKILLGPGYKVIKDAGPRGLDFISWVVEGEAASVGEGNILFSEDQRNLKSAGPRESLNKSQATARRAGAGRSSGLARRRRSKVVFLKGSGPQDPAFSSAHAHGQHSARGGQVTRFGETPALSRLKFRALHCCGGMKLEIRRVSVALAARASVSPGNSSGPRLRTPVGCLRGRRQREAKCRGTGKRLESRACVPASCPVGGARGGARSRVGHSGTRASCASA